MGITNAIEAIGQDLRCAGRGWRKNPCFVVVVVLTLGLGIGVNVALFTVLDALLWATPPVRKPGEIVEVRLQNKDGLWTVSYDEYRALRDANTVLRGLAAYRVLTVTSPYGLARVNVVSENYFAVLGGEFAIGRGFGSDEEAGGVGVLSFRAWQRHFRGDRSVLGKTIHLAGLPLTIIGVTVRQFGGLEPEIPDLWVPIAMGSALESRNVPGEGPDLPPPLTMVGRLAPHVSATQAHYALLALASHLPRGATPIVAAEVKLRDRLYPPPSETTFRRVYMPMAVVLGLVLLIACANVANLQLARASTRRMEMRVRLSVGAGRARIVQQLLTESTALALMGGVVGMLAAQWLIQWAMHAEASPGGTSAHELLRIGTADIHPNLHVLVYTLLVSLMTSVAFGLVPALQAARSDVTSGVSGRAPVFFRGRWNWGTRGRLVAMQLAASVVLLTGTSLLLRSVLNVQATDFGFDAQEVLDIRITPKFGRDDPQLRRLLAERLHYLPHFAAVSLAYRFPSWAQTFAVVRSQGRELLWYNYVRPEFFRVLRLPLAAGRQFAEDEVMTEAAVAIISQDAAAALWPGQDPIGRQIQIGDSGGANAPMFRWVRPGMVEVIGVTKSSGVVLHRGLVHNARCIYLPTRSDHPALRSLLVRVSGSRKDAIAAVTREARALDPDAVVEIHSLSEELAEFLSPPQLLVVVVGCLAFMGLLLATLGLYGTMSYAVVERTQEIGIRVALGAEIHGVWLLVLGWGLRLAVAGAVAGVAVAAILSPLAAPYLYEVNRFDVVTFITVPLFLVLVCLIAAALPAYRAARQDPMVALRHL